MDCEVVELIQKLPSPKSYSQVAYLGRFPYNLINVGNLESYYKLLADFKFISQKINYPSFGVQALIEDYDLIDNPELLNDLELLNHPEYDSEKIKTLKLIQGALQLSAHILNQDKTQLTEQLLGRLQSPEIKKPEIRQLLKQAINSKTSPWLRPLTPSLTPPGGGLIRTFEGHSQWVNAVAYAPDGQRAISASDDNTLKLWDLETGEEIHTFTGHSHSVYAVAYAPDGQRAISASHDNTLKLWNLETGEEIHTFTGHSDWVSAVAYAPDGQRAISVSGDKTLKLWNLETGEVIANFSGESSMYCCAISADGVTIMAGEASGRLHFLRLEGV